MIDRMKEFQFHPEGSVRTLQRYREFHHHRGLSEEIRSRARPRDERNHEGIIRVRTCARYLVGIEMLRSGFSALQEIPRLRHVFTPPCTELGRGLGIQYERQDLADISSMNLVFLEEILNRSRGAPTTDGAIRASRIRRRELSCGVYIGIPGNRRTLSEREESPLHE